MRRPFLPCCCAFTLFCDDQNMKTAELRTNISKQDLHTEIDCYLMGSTVRNSGRVPWLWGQTANSLSESTAALILTSLYWEEARNTGKLYSLKFLAEQEVFLEECKENSSAGHLKKVLELKLRLSLLGPTLTTYNLALSSVKRGRDISEKQFF